MADERVFREQFAIDVRTRCEAISISPKNKTVELRNVVTGEVTTESYDKLVLSPGAAPISPPLPGIDLPGVFQVRTVPDVRAIREWIEGHTALPSGMHAYTGYPDGDAGQTCGRGRRWLYRPGDGGKPDSSWAPGDAYSKG